MDGGTFDCSTGGGTGAAGAKRGTMAPARRPIVGAHGAQQVQQLQLQQQLQQLHLQNHNIQQHPQHQQGKSKNKKKKGAV